MSVVALFPASNDFTALWDNLGDHTGLFIGAQGTNYLLKYRGGSEQVTNLVMLLMEFPGCNISILT